MDTKERAKKVIIKQVSRMETVSNYLIPASSNSYDKGINSPNNVKRLFLTGDMALVEYHMKVKLSNGNVTGFNIKEYSKNCVDSGLLGLVRPLVCSMVEEIIIDNTLVAGSKLKDVGDLDSLLSVVGEELSKGNVLLENRFPRLRSILVTKGLNLKNTYAYLKSIHDTEENDNTFSHLLTKQPTLGVEVAEFYQPKKDWYKGSYYRPLNYEFDNKLKDYFKKKEADVQSQVDKKLLENYEKKQENTQNKTSEYFSENKNVLVPFLEFFSLLGNNTIDFCEFIKDNPNKYGVLFPVDFVYIARVNKLNLDLEKLYMTAINAGLPKKKLAKSVNSLEYTIEKLEYGHNKCVNDYRASRNKPMPGFDPEQLIDPEEPIDNEDLIDPDELGANEDLIDPDDANTDVDDTEKNNEVQEASEAEIKEYLQVLDNVLVYCDYVREDTVISQIRTMNYQGLVLSDYYYNLYVEELDLKNFSVHNLSNLINMIGVSKEVIKTVRLDSETIQVSLEILKILLEILKKSKQYNKMLVKDFVLYLKNQGYSEFDEPKLKKFSRTFMGNRASKVTPEGLQALKPYIEAKYLNHVRNSDTLIYINKDYDANNFDSYSFKVFYKDSEAFVDFYINLPNSAAEYTRQDMNAFIVNDYQDCFPDNICPFLNVYSIQHENSTPLNFLHCIVTKTEFDTKAVSLTDLVEGRDSTLATLCGDGFNYGDPSQVVFGFTPKELYTINSNVLANRSAIVAGETGSGKTVMMWDIILQLIHQGLPPIAVDIKGELAGVMNELGFLGFSDTNPLDKDLLYYDVKKGKLTPTRDMDPWAIGLDLQMCVYKYYKKKLNIMKAKTFEEYNQKTSGKKLVPLIYIVDELESLYDSKKRPLNNATVRNIQTLSSQTRTAGIWRLYGTQTPKTSDLGSGLVTNISNKFMGKKLSSNVVTGSLKLTYNDTMYNKINRDDIRGEFVGYRGNSMTIVKSFLAPESVEEIKSFLLKYSAEGYRSALQYLNQLFADMQAEDAFKQYPHVEWYLKELGRLGSNATNVFESIKSSQDINTINYKSTEIPKLNAEDTNENVGNDIETEEPMIFRMSDANSGGKETSTPVNTQVQDGHSEQLINATGTHIRNFDNVIEVNADLSNQTYPWAKINGLRGKLLQATGMTGEALYRDLTNLITNEIKKANAGLVNVYTLGFIGGYLVVNDRLLNINVSLYEGQIESPIVLDIIEKGLWGEVFDFKALNKFKNLTRLEIEGRTTFNKLKSDLRINTFNEFHKLFPKLAEFIVDGKEINMTGFTTPNEQRYNKISKQYEKVSEYKYTPEKYNLVENFYKKPNIPVKYKIAGTMAAAGVLGVIGLFAGPFVGPAFLLSSVINTLRKK